MPDYRLTWPGPARPGLAAQGMLTLPLKSTAAAVRQRIVAYRPPPAPGPRPRPDLWPGADDAGAEAAA